MNNVHILFRNGKEICLRCDDFEVTRRDDGKIEKINYTMNMGKIKDTILYVDLDEISCIYSN